MVRFLGFHSHFASSTSRTLRVSTSREKGLGRILRGQHGVTEGCKEDLHGETDGLLVLGQQDGFFATGRLGRCFDGDLGCFRGNKPGQVELEGGALARRASNVDEAVVLLDNPKDGGQAQARALPRAVGGEKQHCFNLCAAGRS